VELPKISIASLFSFALHPPSVCGSNEWIPPEQMVLVPLDAGEHWSLPQQEPPPLSWGRFTFLPPFLQLKGVFFFFRAGQVFSRTFDKGALSSLYTSPFPPFSSGPTLFERLNKIFSTIPPFFAALLVRRRFGVLFAHFRPWISLSRRRVRLESYADFPPPFFVVGIVLGPFASFSF